MLDVTRLRVLVAVARTGSVTAAAQELNYAQPSVSHHIARLEAETGARLLQRAGRGIRLTAAGRLLAERAEEILGRIDAAENEPAAAARLDADSPGVDLSLTEAEPPEAMRMLRAGYVEVALVFRYHDTEASPPPAADDEGARGVLLLDEPVQLITPAAEPGMDGPDGLGTVADFAGHRWIAGCERCRGFLLGACERAGFTPRISFTTDDYLAVQALVAARLGVATLPDLAL